MTEMRGGPCVGGPFNGGFRAWTGKEFVVKTLDGSPFDAPDVPMKIVTGTYRWSDFGLFWNWIGNA